MGIWTSISLIYYTIPIYRAQSQLGRQFIIKYMNKTFDPFPRYPPAGYKIDNLNESTGACLNPPNNPPKTPEEFAHYRRSFKQRPGVTIPHYGSAHDSLPPTTHSYGQKILKSETAGDVLQAQQTKGVNSFINGLNETKYASYKNEPLGKSINRQYNLPQECGQEQFKYGKRTEGNEFSAKQTLCPNDDLGQTEEIKKMYLKSHGSFEPGEQKNREFEWNVNPAEYRFGKGEKNPVHNEMYQVMHPEAVAESFKQTKFVKTNYDDFVNFKDDKLGKPRNLGQTTNLPADFRYGVKLSTNEWGVGKCITGEASFKEVEDDSGLGKSNKIGSRNVTRQGDENRIFGVPSIRTDVVKPKNLSVANSMNYGQESRAIELLFPPSYSELGITEEDFLELRDRKTIREIFYNIGYDLDSLQFQEAYSGAKRDTSSKNDTVSVRSFLNSLYALNLQRPHHHH